MHREVLSLSVGKCRMQMGGMIDHIDKQGRSLQISKYTVIRYRKDGPQNLLYLMIIHLILSLNWMHLKTTQHVVYY